MSVVYASGLLAQEPVDLTTEVRRTVEHFQSHGLAGSDLEAAKSALRSLDQTEVANALVAELDADRGDLEKNNIRDATVHFLYTQLSLPASIVISELAQAQSAYKKYQLMRCLPTTNAPEVIAALLKQINDRRVAVNPSQRSVEGEGLTYGFRVCDCAAGRLNVDLGGSAPSIMWWTPIEERDRIIKRILREQKLDAR